MIKSVAKAILAGFIVGAIGVVIAPLGLQIAAIEFFRPILIPGIDVLQPLWLHAFGAVISPAWLLGLILNGVAYATLFLIISLIRLCGFSGVIIWLMTLAVIFAFLAFTGMLTRICDWFTPLYRSWIAPIGHEIFEP
jgi:hypothetical protein